MKHYYSSLGENWFTYPKLYADMVAHFHDGSLFVEVGSWKGMSAAYMGVEIINSGKNIKLHCVDSWQYLDSQTEIKRSQFANLYETFIDNTKPVAEVVKPVRAISWEAADIYPDGTIDFVFIDAAHDYESVRKDLHAWYPKVKPGGIFAGHDYSWGADVRKAVNQFFKGNPIQESEGCWIYHKPNHII